MLFHRNSFFVDILIFLQNGDLQLHVMSLVVHDNFSLSENLTVNVLPGGNFIISGITLTTGDIASVNWPPNGQVLRNFYALSFFPPISLSPLVNLFFFSLLLRSP